VPDQGFETYEPGPWLGDCDSGGNVTLKAGEDKTCSVTNYERQVG
jgi:hypothetical protein